jgi:branched-subunit amino acid aminotransferase/4-amino-4-deoxychorismate lyase
MRYRWNGSDLVDVTGAPTLPLLVADSFLVAEGLVVGYDAHLARFTDSARRQGLVRSIDAFLDAVTAALPRSGRVFPRLDLTERGELELWVRPAPPTTETITLTTASHDPRTEPRLKGPDLPALLELRAEANTVGAGDAILLDSAGRVTDGCTTCLVWMRDRTVFTVPSDAPAVASVTVGVVRQLAAEQGIEVAEQWVTPAALAGAQVWAVNALHGIRGVTAWLGEPDLSFEVDHDHLTRLRAAWADLATPLP